MEPKELAYADWKNGMKYKEIAEKYGVTLSAVKSWASRDWKRRQVATKNEKKLQPKSKKLQPKKRAASSVLIVERLPEAVKETGELTEKQRKFIDYYVEFGNAKEAAIKAGYSKKTAKQIGNENLTKLDREIKFKIREKDDERIASQDEVLRFYSSVLRNEVTEEVVVIEGKGKGWSAARSINKAISAKDRLKAGELLGKRYGIDKAENEKMEPLEIIIKRAQKKQE